VGVSSLVALKMALPETMLCSRISVCFMDNLSDSEKKHYTVLCTLHTVLTARKGNCYPVVLQLILAKLR